MLRLFLPLFFFLPFFLAAQEDNLKFYQNNDIAKDTAAITALLSKARSLRHHNDDSCLILYRAAYRKSAEIKFAEGIARALTGLGLAYMDKGDYNKSLAVYNFAEPYCKIVSAVNGRATVVLYNNIAALYGNRGIADSAATYYYKALEQMEVHQLKDTNVLLLIYSNLAGRLTGNKQYHQARFYLNKALPIALQTNNKKMLAKIYTDFGMLYGAENKFDSSRFFSKKAISLFAHVKDPASEIIAHCNIGNTFLQEKRPMKALPYYQRALNIHGSKVQKAIIYRGLGACNYQLKNYTVAEQYYQDALAISKEENLNKGIIESNKALVDIYTATGNYKAALEHRNAYDALQDSALNAQRSVAVNDLEIRYRTAEKDKELAEQQLLLQEKESKIRGQNRLLLFIASAAILLFALLAALYRNYKQRKNLELLRLKSEREISQIKAIMQGEERERARIARELHDGIMVQFSAAQMNLSAFIEHTDLRRSDEVERILEQLENATKELRKSAHNLMPDMLLKEGIVGATHYFVKSLERNTGIKTDFQLIGKMPLITPDYELMLYRIIQELLQNAIKHAKASYLLVQINCSADMISIAVEDNGIGFDPAGQANKGMGLAGIESRIASLKGHFNISSRQGEGTSAYIELYTEYLKSNSLAHAD